MAERTRRTAVEMPAPKLRELARRRLEHPDRFDPEAWAKEVEEARTRGYRLLCVPGLIVSIRDYSLEPGDG